MRRNKQKSLSLLLCICLLMQVFAPVSAMAKTESNPGDLLYFVNCAATKIDQTADGDQMGEYQSVTDQVYGEDASTGHAWGYVENADMVSGGSKDSLVKTDTYWYTSDKIEFDPATSGFRYNFAVEDGFYEVTIGIKIPNWWSSRKVDIDLENERVASQASVPGGNSPNATFTKTAEVLVEDGELNVFVHNEKRTSGNDDPMLSYILVKRGQSYGADTVKEKIEEIQNKLALDEINGIVYAEKPLGELYVGEEDKEDNLQAMNAALAEAQALAEQENPGTRAVKEMCERLDAIYKNLRSIEVYDSFSGTDGAVWKDTNGKPIQAHGGQVQKMTMPDGSEKWWWIGEDKTTGSHSNGISTYSSDDLFNWTFEGYAMRSVPSREALDTDPYFTALYGDLSPEEKDYVYLCINKTTAIIERPKMIYNEKTGKYIIWFHADGPTEESTSSYAAAAAGMAISDTPNGPFTFIRRSRLHQLPEEEYYEDNGVLDWYEEESNRGFARDMNLFIDDDGVAYIIYSSEENRTMFISRLNDEYTDLDVAQDPVGLAKNGVDFVRLFPGAQREAPALFKYDGTYYMITSGATGWSPNPARYWKADEILGEWTDMGDPCVGDVDGKTFWTQSTNVIPVDPENGKFIYMGDRWGYGKVQDFSAAALADSRYVWLPVEIDATGHVTLNDVKEWDLSYFDNINNLKLKSEMDDLYYGADTLPAQADVSVREDGKWTDHKVQINWNLSSLIPGAKSKVTGTLEGFDGMTLTTEVMDIPEGMLYYIDSGAAKGSNYYDIISEKAPNLVNTESWDQAYQDGGWGYTGTDADIGNKNPDSLDAYTSGWWAKGGKNIDYKLPLKAGEYLLSLGFQEWWSVSRPMKAVVSYTGADGEKVETTVGTVTNSGEKAVLFPFTVANDADVTISVQRQNSSNPDPILSWLAITGEVKDEPEPEEHSLTVNFPAAKAELSIDNQDLGFANLIGRYQDTVMGGDELTLDFTPRNGREFASITVNDAPVSIKDTNSYSYDLTMPNADTTLDFAFVTVDKSVLRTIVTTAEGLLGGEEYNGAVPSVQKRFNAALEAAQKTADQIDATQEEINKAWSDLLDIIQYLSFAKGDKTALEQLLEMTEDLREENYSDASWAVYLKALETAQGVVADEDALKNDVEEAYQALRDAILALDEGANWQTLRTLIEAAEEIEANLDAYLDTGKQDFIDALDNARELTDGATQKEIDKAAGALTDAMGKLLLIPNKDALREQVEEASAIDLSKYTTASATAVANAVTAANAVLDNPQATEAMVKAAESTLSQAVDALVEKNNENDDHNSGNTGGGSKSGSTSKAPVSNDTYGADGIAAAGASVAQTASVISDTTVDFVLKRGQAYCFKMSVVNGNGQAPAFTVGNGGVLKTQFVAQIGSDYFYRVWAVGAPDANTGVYTTLPGAAPVKHCTVTVG